MRKPRLTRLKQRRYLPCARIMQQEGILLEIPDEWIELACPLEITIAGPPDSEVFEHSRGGLRYSVYLRLLSKARCMVEHVAITVPWDDQIMLESLDQRYPVGMYEYPPVSWKEVLNSRIEGGLKFRCNGEVVQGFLLARGTAPLPEGYRTGQSVPFTLGLYDQYGFEMPEQGYLYVQRAEGNTKKVHAPVEDLFGNPRIDPQLTKHTSTIVRGETEKSNKSPLHLAGCFEEASEGKIE